MSLPLQRAKISQFNKRQDIQVVHHKDGSFGILGVIGAAHVVMQVESKLLDVCLSLQYAKIYQCNRRKSIQAVHHMQNFDIITAKSHIQKPGGKIKFRTLDYKIGNVRQDYDGDFVLPEGYWFLHTNWATSGTGNTGMARIFKDNVEICRS